MVAEGASLLKGAGDGDVGPSAILIDHIEPVAGIKFEAIDPIAVAPLSGLRGSLVCQVGMGGAAGTAGALQMTLNPCILLSKGTSHAYRKFSDCDLEAHGICSNGNPLSWSKLAGPSQMEIPPVPTGAGA